jgi:hypothetical protein
MQTKSTACIQTYVLPAKISMNGKGRKVLVVVIISFLEVIELVQPSDGTGTFNSIHLQPDFLCDGFLLQIIIIIFQ